MKGSDFLPFFVIREDITRLKVDAIVNSTNSDMKPTGGADGAIHKAAGPQLQAECEALSPLEVGEAKITLGYDLAAGHVIHVIAPKWQGGAMGEREALSKVYKNSLSAALGAGLESVGFSLISSGAYGFPHSVAVECANKAITDFIKHNDITVYLAVFDNNSYKASSAVFPEIESYIDSEYAKSHMRLFREHRRRSLPPRDFSFDACYSVAAASNDDILGDFNDDIENLFNSLDDPFSVTLLKLIDAKGMSDVECYKRSNVSKKTFWKIVNQKDYRPSKSTVLSFAIGLGLSLDETEHLLSTVGFAFSGSNKFDIIVKYFIKKESYDIFEINEVLFKFDQPLLGVG